MSTLLKFIDVMEKVQFDYSIKKMRIPSERNYKLQLMEKIELIIKRMWWKAYFYKEKKYDKENKTQAMLET